VFENDLDRLQQTLSLERVRDRQLLTNAQVFHRSPPPENLGGERAMEPNYKTVSAGLVSA
jgi:hypothetical protein